MRTTIGTVIAVAALAVVAACGGGSTSHGVTLTGAGSTFVYPLVSQWAPVLGSADGLSINYNPIGSGGGVLAITTRQVDFGASDAPMTPDQITACKGCVQIPWALSATAIVYNLPGVKDHLHVDGPTLARIFSGQITRWDDPALRKLNPGVTLPSTRIATVHRSDNSGTTYNLTDYLSRVSPSWNSKFGTGVAVDWPGGTSGKGSSGVAAQVLQTAGAIGYVDVAYALKSSIKFFAVENRSNAFTTPGIGSILAAAKASTSLSIVNAPTAGAYPISTFTYVIVPLRTAKATELKQMILWALTKGQAYGPKLLFAPLPQRVRLVAEKALARIHA